MWSLSSAKRLNAHQQSVPSDPVYLPYCDQCPVQYVLFCARKCGREMQWFAGVGQEEARAFHVRAVTLLRTRCGARSSQHHHLSFHTTTTMRHVRLC
jgi:hypothetical protein